MHADVKFNDESIDIAMEQSCRKDQLIKAIWRILAIIKLIECFVANFLDIVLIRPCQLTSSEQMNFVI